MEKATNGRKHPGLRSKRMATCFGIGIIGLLMCVTSIQAFYFDTGNPDLKMRWDNTPKYSAAFRVEDPSNKLVAAPVEVNEDDGNRNFDKGLISSRFDLLSEFDIEYKRFGVRFSGAGWYDPVYLAHNDNDSPFTANAFSVAHNRFTDDTEQQHGLNAELLDAFVFGTKDIGNAALSFRAGSHSIQYGESLFFGNNGIAGGMAPVDIVKLLSVPNSQFKEIIRPVPQVSMQLQFGQSFSIGAYYQFHWEESRLPAFDSYFGAQDFVDTGMGERILAGPPVIPGGGPLAFFHGRDLEGSNSGQFGVQMRFGIGDYDLGLYALNYHDKTPQIYMRPDAAPNPVTGRVGEYFYAYPENIQAYGASATTSFGIMNLAAEVSFRKNMPLVSDAAMVFPGVRADNDDHPLYAVGDSFHAQISTFTTLGPTFLYDEALLLGEVASNLRLKITDNPQALDPNTKHHAWGLRFVLEPKYNRVLPGLDLGVPIGMSYFPEGASSVVGNFGPDEGGDMNIGLKATYRFVWIVNLNYTHFYGSSGTFFDPNMHLSFDQVYSDRDFVSFSVSRSF